MRRRWMIACLTVCLLAPLLRAEGYTYPPQVNGVTKGTLTVTVAEFDASKPAQVDYLLVLETTTDFFVEAPQLLEDKPLWKSTIAPAELQVDGAEQLLRFKIHLEQIGAGKQPLPDLRVRFRKDNLGEWDELTWTGILKEPRPLRLPEAATPDPPLQKPDLFWWLIGSLAACLTLLGLTVRWFWTRQRTLPLSLEESAVRELARIEGLGLAGPDESGWYPVELASFMRQFLTQRFTLPAQQQTTVEFLDTLRRLTALGEEQQQTAKELLERCDLAKFAGARLSPEDCRHLAGLARTLIKKELLAP